MSEFIPGTWADVKPTHNMVNDSWYLHQQAEEAWKYRDTLIEQYYYRQPSDGLVVTYQMIQDAEDKAAELDRQYRRMWAEENEYQPNQYDFFGIQ